MFSHLRLSQQCEGGVCPPDSRGHRHRGIGSGVGVLGGGKGEGRELFATFLPDSSSHFSMSGPDPRPSVQTLCTHKKTWRSHKNVAFAQKTLRSPSVKLTVEGIKSEMNVGTYANFMSGVCTFLKVLICWQHLQATQYNYLT